MLWTWLLFSFACQATADSYNGIEQVGLLYPVVTVLNSGLGLGLVDGLYYTLNDIPASNSIYYHVDCNQEQVDSFESLVQGNAYFKDAFTPEDGLVLSTKPYVDCSQVLSPGYVNWDDIDKGIVKVPLVQDSDIGLSWAQYSRSSCCSESGCSDGCYPVASSHCYVEVYAVWPSVTIEQAKETADSTQSALLEQESITGSVDDPRNYFAKGICVACSKKNCTWSCKNGQVFQRFSI